MATQPCLIGLYSLPKWLQASASKDVKGWEIPNISDLIFLPGLCGLCLWLLAAVCLSQTHQGTHPSETPHTNTAAGCEGIEHGALLPWVASLQLHEHYKWKKLTLSILALFFLFFFCYSFLLSSSGTWVLSMCISALGRGGEGAGRTSYKSSSALLRFILVRQWLFLLKCFVKALPNDLLAGERLNSCMIFFVWWRKNSAIIQNSKWVLASC